MRVLTLATALAFLPLATTARAAEVPTFAGMSWGASDSAVVEAASAAGLRLVQKDEAGDYEFAGDVFGAPAVVYAYMSPGHGLVKVQIRLTARDGRPAQAYASVVEQLAQEYGSTEPVEHFKAPYARGDGREDEAVVNGKGLLISAWGDERLPGQAALIVRAARLVVGLDYESHGWMAEYERRKRQAASAGPRLASRLRVDDRS
jgi:hypothetical protein